MSILDFPLVQIKQVIEWVKRRDVPTLEEFEALLDVLRFIGRQGAAVFGQNGVPQGAAAVVAPPALNDEVAEAEVLASLESLATLPEGAQPFLGGAFGKAILPVLVKWLAEAAAKRLAGGK